MESWVKPITGDWAGLRGCAAGFRNLATGLERASDNLRHSQLNMHDAWQGNAADTCNAHLQKMRLAIQATPEQLHKIAKEYQDAADGAHEISGAVGTLLMELIEAACIFMLEVSVAAASSETVVGGVVFGAAALYEAYRIVKLVLDIVDYYNRLDNFMDAANSAMKDFGMVKPGDTHLPTLDELAKAPPLPALGT